MGKKSTGATAVAATPPQRESAQKHESPCAAEVSSPLTYIILIIFFLIFTQSWGAHTLFKPGFVTS